MERQPNTIYVASISYGKDSLAMLEAIKRLGYPLDRIVSVQVWATDTIPADLPEMYEWKNKADEIIYQKYGLRVERVCATKDDRQRITPTASTNSCVKEDMSAKSKASHKQTAVGAENSNTSILTYADIFYRQRKKRGGDGTTPTASQQEKGIGVRVNSKCDQRKTIIGFPRYGSRGNKCSGELKTKVFGNARQHNGRNKYCAVHWHCFGRAYSHRTAQRQEGHCNAVS